MTIEEFVNRMRQEIRDAGFMSATRLATIVVVDAREHELYADPLEILSMIPCEDIKKVEYANTQTAEYRRKDLYYYSP
jgi:hypothetical protein